MKNTIKQLGKKEREYMILTKIQPAFKRKLRIYKYIERVQKFLKSSYPDEQKEKVSEIIGLAGVLFSSYIDKKKIEKYDIYFLSAYFIMYAVICSTCDELVVPPNESAKFVRVYYSMLTIAKVVLHIPLGGVE